MSAVDCCSVPGLTPLNQALEQLLNEVRPIQEQEIIPLNKALGRVLAQPAISTLNIPSADNSAMDGYALRIDQSEVSPTAEYKMIGKVFAGHPFKHEIQPGECVRIMTGAQIPDSANAVVMQENVTANDDLIVLNHSVKQGDHIRRAGEDIKSGQLVLDAGRRLRPADIGLLASLGIAQVTVTKALTVAIISTGDELCRPGDPLQEGQFYESNGYTVHAGLTRLAVNIIDFGIIKDDLDELRSVFKQADEVADAVITSGGVSVGEADYTKTVLEELGTIAFWKLAIKPGKPFAFGHLPNSYFIGLPGNPVSSLVTFHQLAVPLLRKISGANSETPLRISAIASSDLKKSPGRTDFQRGVFSVNDQGQIEVQATGAQGSGILSSMSAANCYIILEQERGRVSKGEIVTVEPFDEILK